ncbi:unnamed protein product [Brachionus calyciflorus]|uniref:MULE transposase domain-containing protein n=1 Tax=Brachionus calyciflorus TaxID=104777 RepID=A0A814DUA7_9BILA|nr:unnamed protein product [Brachionus calyciflorus]
MIAGIIDFDRHFHPIAVAICSRETALDYEFFFRSIFKNNKSYVPKIMCWAHAERATTKKLLFIKNPRVRDNITQDLYALQSSYSQPKFNIGYKLFKEKWKSVEGMRKFFDDYFEREWISLTNQGWFEGLAPGYPSTNNA